MKKRKLIILLLIVAITASLCTVTVFADEDDEGEAVSLGDVLSGNASLGEMFADIFNKAISNWLSGIVNNAISVIEKLVMNTMDSALHIEKYFSENQGSTVLSTTMLQEIYAYIYSIASILVTIKLLFRGFQIYILWRNGDAEASPREMLIGGVQAQIVMLAFPYLYNLCADIVKELTEGIVFRLGGSTGQVFPTGLVETAKVYIGAPLTLIFLVIWFILLFVLWIKLLVQGFEMLVLRLGLPFATAGLIDSDMALFKNYIQVFIKTFLTLVIQITLMSLSLRVIMTSINEPKAIYLSLAIISTALSTPKLMQQFLVPQQSGGALQKASSAAIVLRTVVALV